MTHSLQSADTAFSSLNDIMTCNRLTSSDRTLTENCLLGAGVLGDGLGALRHGGLGQLTREEEPESGTFNG